MAQHDPVEDALNARKARARLVEAGGALSPDNLDITRQFLGGQPVQFDPSRRGGGGQRGRFGPDRIRGIPENPFPFPGRGAPESLSVEGMRSRLPSQASDVASERSFGQQGLLQRNDPRAITPIIQEDERLRGQVSGLRDRFFNLPGP
ncbi:hypothetical protein LCGC14_2561860, partial [marine sediment metagenome]